MTGFSDERRFPRTPAAFPVRFRVVPDGGGRYYEARGVDLSAAGLRFFSAEAVPPRAGLIVELRLPGEPPLRSLGRVAWVRELPDEFGFEVGGPLIEPSTAARLRIERYLRNVDPGGAGERMGLAANAH